MTDSLNDQLVRNHGIDYTLFAEGFITLGADQGWRSAIDRHAKAKQKLVLEDDSLRNNEVAQKERAIVRNADLTFRETPSINWNLYSAVITDRGVIKPGLEWAGQRLHPSLRTGGDNQIKFDCRSTRVKVFLPPLSWDGAMQLLDHHGFDCPKDQYSVDKAWRFIFSCPDVSIYVEESALKALASTSIGQVAVGLNGISSSGQKTRSDRLRKPLQMLSEGGRKVTIRFDAGTSSQQRAQAIHRQLEKAGADAAWYCWIGEHGKTDDYVSAKLRGMEVTASLPILGHQEDIRVRGFASQEPYSRLRGDWSTVTVDREFLAQDVVEASKVSRLVALVGATGTSKTKASVAAVELLERQLGHRMVVLGLYHRASLVHKGASEFGVRDMSAAKGSVERTMGLHEGIHCRDGLFCCCESIKKPSGNEEDMWRWSHELKEKPRPTVLFLDELTQSALHLLVGGTEGMVDSRREAVNTLERLLSNPCVTVITAESGLGDIDLEWLEATTGSRPRVIRSTFTRKQTLYVGEVSRDNVGFLQQLSLKALQSGHKVWSSFGEAGGMIDYSSPFKEEYKVLQISADNSSSKEVAEFMSDTENAGDCYDVVSMSPSVISGISYTGEVGLASCVQQFAMGPEDALQALARARNSNMRILLMPSVVPAAMIGTGKSSYKEVQRAKSKAAGHGDIDTYMDFAKSISTASLFYSHKLEARNNYEAIANEHVLQCRLEEQGYDLKLFMELLGEPNTRPCTRQVRIKKEKEISSSFRQDLLRKLMKGEMLLGEAREIAKKASKTGLTTDYEQRDPSHAFYWLQRLSVDSLVNCGKFYEGSEEFVLVSSLAQALNKAEAQELRGLMGGKVVVPGPDDVVKATFIKALVQLAGFTVTRASRVRLDGKQVWSYAVS